MIFPALLTNYSNSYSCPAQQFNSSQINFQMKITEQNSLSRTARFLEPFVNHVIVHVMWARYSVLWFHWPSTLSEGEMRAWHRQGEFRHVWEALPRTRHVDHCTRNSSHPITASLSEWPSSLITALLIWAGVLF